MSDEQQIRALIEAWAIAAHDGDLATVLADHAPDIVMFDVPPPDQGLRGIDAYRATCRPGSGHRRRRRGQARAPVAASTGEPG